MTKFAEFEDELKTILDSHTKQNGEQNFLLTQDLKDYLSCFSPNQIEKQKLQTLLKKDQDWWQGQIKERKRSEP